MARADAAAGGDRNGSPVAFFLLTLALCAPFWVAGALKGGELMPRLPLAALAFVCPGLAALILAGREGGWRGTLALLARPLDARRMPSWIWAAVALAIPIAAAVTGWQVQRMTGVAVPSTQFPPALLASLTASFFVAGAAEEIGWSGYVLNPLQARLGALRASLVIGVAWAALHYVPLLQADRSWSWIAWWTLGTVSMRVVMVWLVGRAGGSVFAATLFHMATNLAWQLYPVRGSYFDPRLHGLFMAAVALGLVGWDALISRQAPGSAARPST